MNHEVEHLVLALIIGFVTGSFSGAFGIGGGTVSTPLLRLTMHISPHTAVGTTMALIIPTAISATLNYYRKKEIDLSMGFTMILPAVLGVVFGALATTVVEGRALMFSFAAFVCIAGLDLSFGVVQKMFKRSAETAPPQNVDASSTNKGDTSSANKDDASSIDKNDASLADIHGKSSSTEPGTSVDPKKTVKLVTIGFFAGLMAGFFGVGGGFIFVPCLMYLFKTPIKTAFGTSLLVVAAISVPGTITHALTGHVDFPLMLSMMGGSIPGSFVGSTLALKLKDSWLRRGFGVAMLCVAFALAGNELLN